MVNSNEKVQVYLEGCNQACVVKALANGLDRECYRRYLEAIYFALPADCDLRAQYEQAIREAREEAGRSVNLTTATNWVFAINETFTKQLTMLMDLVAYIDQNGEDVDEIRIAQLNFVQDTLWLERRVLDTILAWAPSSMILRCETDSTREYANVLQLYDRVHRYATNVALKYVSDQET